MDGENITIIPDVKIDALYAKYSKKPQKGGFFVAKASFRYTKNKLYLSYEDNVKNIFTFKNEVIDLTNFDSLKGFIFSHNIGFRRLREIWSGYDKSTELDDFEGCYYVWRDRRVDSLDKYPYGVRVYVNNYGLYRYLNSDDDWLQHSEISQNVKNTNFKLRNTYGYISFKNYSEEESALKISNDRNDFIVNDIPDLIVSTVPTSHIAIDVDPGVVFNEDNMTVCANSLGIHIVRFAYNNIVISVELDVKDPTPRFSLKQEALKSPEGASLELSQYIHKTSIVGMSISDIAISSSEVKIKKNYLSSDTHPGEYIINYSYVDDEYTIVKPLHLTVTPLRLKESKKILDLFPTCRGLVKYFKIKDIIFDMAESYILHPTICMISMRTLIEASFKAFEEEIFNVKINNSSTYDIEQKWKWVKLQIEQKNTQIPSIILEKYQARICASHKSIIKYYKELEPNAYIHRNDTIATSDEVYASVKRFSLWLNFIIDSLLYKQERQ